MQHKLLSALDSHSPTQELVENNTGADIVALRCVKHVATGTTYPQITLAVAGGEVHGITTSTIAAGSTGYIFVYGFLYNQNTIAWAPGTKLYCGALGALSPVLAGAAVGSVFKQHATLGVIQILSLQATTTVVGGGDVFGPVGATDHALARFDLATGKLIQNSVAILDDLGALSALQSVMMDNGGVDGGSLYFNGGTTSFLKSDAAGDVLNIGHFSSIESVSSFSIQANPIAPSTAIAGIDLNITGYGSLYASADTGVSGMAVSHELLAVLGGLGTETGQLTIDGYGSDIAMETAPMIGIDANKAGAGALSVRPVLGVFNNGSRLLDFGPTNSIQAAGDIVLENQKGIRFSEAVAGGANYAKLVAADAMGGNVTWKLPAADGTANQSLKTDGSGNLGWVDSDFANREIVISSGGCTAINTAISTLNGLGGGTVRLDGMIAMDGNVTMMSNVLLKGYGSGTGLSNATANTYYINFVGAAPTAYGIAAPVASNDFFTCDTVGEAVNFVAGTAAMLEDDDITFDEVQLVYVKKTGNAGTGKVEIYDHIGGIPAIGWSATTVAKPLVFAHAGISDMDVLNTANGFIIVTITYAYDIRFESVLFSECVHDLLECGAIRYHNCKLYSSDSTNFTQHVRLKGWNDTVTFDSCDIRGAVSGLSWTPAAKAVRRLSVRDCHFSGCTYGINLTVGDSLTTSMDGFLVTGTVFDLLEPPGSGGGASVGIISTTVLIRNLVFTGNDMTRCDSGTLFFAANGASKLRDFTISGNKFGSSAIYIYNALNGVIGGNDSDGRLVLIEGADQITVTGNSFTDLYLQVGGGLGYAQHCAVSGNRFSGTVFFAPSAGAEYVKECTFSGNMCDGDVNLMNDTYEIVVTGNTILGTLGVGSLGGDINDKLTITGNHIGGNIVFTETDQDDCVIGDNVVEGTITALTGTGNVLIDNAGSSLPTDLAMRNQAGIKFYEQVGTGSNFVKLEAPDALGGDVTWKLPNADGAANQTLKTDGSGNLGWVDSDFASREIVVSSGGCAAINTAITTLNGLGGGTVRIDGLIAMDADITMMSNVVLKGYGPGTGLRNATANAYKINFVGATPTTYQIAAPVNGVDNFVCDTVAEAVNFVAGTAAILEDDDALLDETQLVYVKTTGNGTTGTVEIYDQFSIFVGYGWTATTVAKPLAFCNAGLADMEIQNTAAGSLQIKIQYAYRLKFENLISSECSVNMSECGSIDFSLCQWISTDVLNHARHVEIGSWVDMVDFLNCVIRGAVAGIEWTGPKAARRISIRDSIVSGCSQGFYMHPSAAPTTTSIAYIEINNNSFMTMESPASGGGIGTGIYGTGTRIEALEVVGNNFSGIQQPIYLNAASGNAHPQNLVISDNSFYGNTVFLFAPMYFTFSGNNNYYSGGLTISNGAAYATISNNVCGMIYLATNTILNTVIDIIVSNNECGNIYFEGTGAQVVSNIVVSGNDCNGITATRNFAESIISDNKCAGSIVLGNTGTANNKLVVANNVVAGNLTWTDQAQADCEILGNQVTGTMTLPTGANNVILQPTNVTINLAAREIIVNSGTSAVVNAAISKINALGGGTVLLSGLIEMDGDITMKTNVLLKGYGPGTGLVNSTANAYDINFVGTTPTVYQIAACGAGNDFFTCDTVGEAVNFVAGTAAILEDDTSAKDEVQLVYIKTTGNAGTGKVEIYDKISPYILGTTWNAATVALSIDFSNSGLCDMDVRNTAAGSINVGIQYAHTLRFSCVKFEEVLIQMDDCGNIDFDQCRHISKDSLSLAKHVAFNNWVDGVNFSECEIRGAIAGFEWTGSKALRNISIYDCYISGCHWGIDWSPTTPGSTSCGGLKINDNFFNNLNDPASGGGVGTAIYCDNLTLANVEICGNDMRNAGTGKSLWFASAYGVSSINCTITGNYFNGAISIGCFVNLVFSGNTVTGTTLFEGGGYQYVVTGNEFATTATFSAGTNWCEEFTISGNYFHSNVLLTQSTAGYIYNLSFTGNTANTYVNCCKNTYQSTFTGNKITGYLQFGAAGGDVNNKLVVSGNYIGTDLTWGNQAQTDCEIIGNYVGGTQTLPTGVRNKIIQEGAPITRISARELIVNSGTSAMINAAIADVSAQGGGTVLLNGLFSLDADITMASNVILSGYGPGTGLVNSTANAYAINFVGTTPTTYQIATPVDGNDYFTCDTVAEAVNFAAGTAALLINDDSTYDDFKLVFIKTTGNAGTGKVEIYDNIDTLSSWTATTVALPLAFSQSGISDMNISNTGAGSLLVSVQYAYNIKFLNVNFIQSTVQLDDCGCITLDMCSLYATTSLSLARCLNIVNWVDGIYIDNCEIRGAIAGIEWSGSKAVRALEVTASHISGCTTAVDLTPGTPSSTSIDRLLISECDIVCEEAPGSGGGNGSGIVSTAIYNKHMQISDSRFLGNQGDSINLAAGAGARPYYPVITGNEFHTTGTVTIAYPYKMMFTGNHHTGTGSLTFSEHCYNCVITGNYIYGNFYMSTTGTNKIDSCVVSGNYIEGIAYIFPSSSASIKNSTFSGNHVANNFDFHGPITESSITGNVVAASLKIGFGGSDDLDKNCITGNFIGTNLTFSNPAGADNCTINGNYVVGTQTLPTGTGNIIFDKNILKTTGAYMVNVTTVNASTYDVLSTDHVLHVTYTGTGAVTNLRLMTAGMLLGRVLRIKDAGGNAAINNITITTEGAELIDGAADYIIGANYNSIDLYTDGVGWFIL